jgi:[ribosomal protein S5]-alanine N-acetyltransferase
MKYLLENEETERLKFRLLEPGDFETWIELFKNEDASGFLGLGKIPTPRERCEEWFKRIKHRYDNDLGGMNVLIDKTTNEFIGQCGLLVQEVDGNTELEIGYSILPRHWNKGYATEAARKCRDYAFVHNFTEYIISLVHIDNTKSEKVALKNGMKLWKTTTFKEMPVKVFRITKSEWLEKNGLIS